MLAIFLRQLSIFSGVFLTLSGQHTIVGGAQVPAEQPQDVKTVPPEIVKPDLFKPLTEPPCSYFLNQNLKQMVRDNDVVLAGRTIGGKLRGTELQSAPSVVCRWYAWGREYP